MQFRIKCNCGKSLRVPSAAKPVSCPECGTQQSVAIPIAGIRAAAPAVEPEPSLPAWTVPIMLVGLVVVSGVIVLVSWIMMTSSPRALLEPKPYAKAHVHQRNVAEANSLQYEKTPVSEEEPILWDKKPLLQRRMPSGIEVPELHVVAPMSAPQPAETPSSPGSVEEKSPSMHSSPSWTIESLPGNRKDLIMPIEIARVENGKTFYNVRRLQFPDIAPKRLRLAVTAFVHDDLGSLLTKMGEGYHFTTLCREDLLSLDALKKHDVIFLTCADLYGVDFQAAMPLRKFVQQGGTLYASDLRGDLVLAAFPEFRAKIPILPGVPQSIEASVVDRGLRSYLDRRTIPLNFEAPDWRPAAFDPNKVTVCLKGAYRNNLGQAWTVPLLVKFPVQKGTVIFTSFHHSKNDTPIVRKLLEYLVFSTVNARSESRVKELMLRSQFTPHDLRPMLLTTDHNIKGIHQHAGGNLQIALGFENVGARLKLTLRSPRGQRFEHEDKGLYQIEIPAAEPGDWQYTVTSVELPYGNFPIIVGIGSPKS